MERISGAQLRLMTGLYTMIITLKYPTVLILEAAKQAAWMSYIAAAVAALFPLWMMDRIFKKVGNKDLAESIIHLSPFFGRMIMSVFLVYFFFSISHDLRFIIDIVNINLLQQTPIIVIGLVIAFTCVFIARGGTEILARMSELFFLLAIVTVVLLPFFLFFQSDVKFLKPLFGDGIKSILLGSWYALGYIGEIIVIPFVLSQSFYDFRKTAHGLFIGVSMLMILIIQTILVFGHEMPTLFYDPPYELVRQIRITDFLDRLDLPIFAVWLPSALIKVSITLYAASRIISQIVPNVSWRLLVSPLCFLALVCSFWFFESAPQLIQIGKIKPFFIVIVSYLMPLLIWITVRLKQRKSKEKINWQSGVQ